MSGELIYNPPETLKFVSSNELATLVKAFNLLVARVEQLEDTIESLEQENKQLHNRLSSLTINQSFMVPDYLTQWRLANMEDINKYQINYTRNTTTTNSDNY